MGVVAAVVVTGSDSVAAGAPTSNRMAECGGRCGYAFEMAPSWARAPVLASASAHSAAHTHTSSDERITRIADG